MKLLKISSRHITLNIKLQRVIKYVDVGETALVNYIMNYSYEENSKISEKEGRDWSILE
jgi:hypothetical protein